MAGSVFAQIGPTLAHAAGEEVVALSKVNRAPGKLRLRQEIAARAVKGGVHVVRPINPEGWDF
jgi:hypothetical protein